jgi:hypothetical protein
MPVSLQVRVTLKCQASGYVRVMEYSTRASLLRTYIELCSIDKDNYK